MISRSNCSKPHDCCYVERVSIWGCIMIHLKKNCSNHKSVSHLVTEVSPSEYEKIDVIERFILPRVVGKLNEFCIWLSITSVIILISNQQCLQKQYCLSLELYKKIKHKNKYNHIANSP